MNPTTTRRYKGMFIIDTRGREESVDQLLEKVKADIAHVHGQVIHVENLGMRDLTRPSDPKFTQAPFVEIQFSGPTDAPRNLQERLRLNPIVYRALFEAS